jgi:hypothetical protein
MPADQFALFTGSPFTASPETASSFNRCRPVVLAHGRY